MSKMTKVADGVVRDENGKLHIAPMKKLITYNQSSCPSVKQKIGIVRRPSIPIEPMTVQFTHSDDSPQNSSKRSKTERQASRRLFKEPQKKPEKRSFLHNHRSPIFGKRPRSSFQIKIPKVGLTNSSLLDIDKAEQLWNKKTLSKTVSFPMGSIEEASTLVNITTEDGNIPTGANLVEQGMGVDPDELEFLQLEKKLASPKKKVEKDNVLEQIKTLINEDRKQFALLQEHFENYSQHNETMKRISELLGESAENKEYVNSTSVDVSTMQVKYVISPAVVDLRKFTLNKNLSKTLQCDSPRTRKALNMYNIIRKDCSVLCTPKLDLTLTDAPQNSATRSLSRRIQKQCLLLQDTPKKS